MSGRDVPSWYGTRVPGYILIMNWDLYLLCRKNTPRRRMTRAEKFVEVELERYLRGLVKNPQLAGFRIRFNGKFFGKSVRRPRP